ncbi:hypothetical protein PsAD2_03417 [Pseudovibrio axinellae]|uniref:Uncharacterized protein n=1 Tax=Pseudovibrio axinellae TaxID=989403 RepID=A0A165WJB4_9HYPH|nr:hypothetical protein [Pseudovibrio axinellae]KZL16598.1 hypothetical protein PsAD2_03417 [Pseudovibrio axinellae]SER91409.1 hypothetical protein SAMN05421798_1594 [Pseudovibrio axinellae]
MPHGIQLNAKAELQKVFKLAARGIHIEMFSEFIDAAWHELLENQKEYEKFSISSCGFIVPHTEGSGKGTVNFVEAYEREFGPLPDLWFASISGDINVGALSHYRDTGEVVASWTCSATHNCIAIFPRVEEPDESYLDKKPSKKVPTVDKPSKEKK